MDNSISVGDLVCVVKPSLCTGEPGSMGLVFTALSLETPGRLRCDSCGGTHEAVGIWVKGPTCWFPIERLQKIDPKRTPESIVERLTVNA
jgi:hypothetical protein